MTRTGVRRAPLPSMPAMHVPPSRTRCARSSVAAVARWTPRCRSCFRASGWWSRRSRARRRRCTGRAGAALVVAVAVTVVRLAQGRRPRSVLFGLLGVAIAAADRGLHRPGRRLLPRPDRQQRRECAGLGRLDRDPVAAARRDRRRPARASGPAGATIRICSRLPAGELGVGGAVPACGWPCSSRCTWPTPWSRSGSRGIVLTWPLVAVCVAVVVAAAALGAAGGSPRHPAPGGTGIGSGSRVSVLTIGDRSATIKGCGSLNLVTIAHPASDADRGTEHLEPWDTPPPSCRHATRAPERAAAAAGRPGHRGARRACPGPDDQQGLRRRRCRRHQRRARIALRRGRHRPRCGRRCGADHGRHLALPALAGTRPLGRHLRASGRRRRAPTSSTPSILAPPVRPGDQPTELIAPADVPGRSRRRTVGYMLATVIGFAIALGLVTGDRGAEGFHAAAGRDRHVGGRVLQGPTGRRRTRSRRPVRLRRRRRRRQVAVRPQPENDTDATEPAEPTRSGQPTSGTTKPSSHADPRADRWSRWPALMAAARTVVPTATGSWKAATGRNAPCASSSPVPPGSSGPTSSNCSAGGRPRGRRARRAAARRHTAPGPTRRRASTVGDVRDAELLAGLLDGVDAVCHQAAMVGHGVSPADAPDYAAHNVVGTAVLLAAMHAAGVRRLVLAGSMVVYGEGRYALRRARRRAAGAACRRRSRRRPVRAALPVVRARSRPGPGRRGRADGPAQHLRRQQALAGAAGRRRGRARPAAACGRCATTTCTARGCPATPRTPGWRRSSGRRWNAARHRG